MIAAAFGRNPQFLIWRVAVDDTLRAVVRLYGSNIAAALAVEIQTLLVDLVFNIGKQAV